MPTIAEAVIKLEVENKELRAKLGEAISDFEKFKSTGDKITGFLQAKWLALTAIFTGVAIVVRKVGRELEEIVRIGAQSEKVQALLENTLKTQTSRWQTLSRAMADYASERQKVTKFDDEAVKGVMTDLILKGVAYGDVLKIMPSILDLASARQMDLATAGYIVARAYNGQIEMLKRYGIFIKATGDKGKDFAQVIDYIREKMGGFAELEGRTVAGRLDILKNKFSELKESIFRELAPAIEKVLDAFNKLLSQREYSSDPIIAGIQKEIEEYQKIQKNILPGLMAEEARRESYLGIQWTTLKDLTVEEERMLLLVRGDVGTHTYLNELLAKIKARKEEIKKEMELINAENEKSKKLQEEELLISKEQNMTMKQRVDLLTIAIKDEQISYDTKLRLLNQYYQAGYISEYRLNTLKKQLMDDEVERFRVNNELMVSINDKTATIMTDAFETEFVKNVGANLDKLNINFNNIFESIKTAFFKMLAEMAAKAVVFGLLDFITGGAFGKAQKGGFLGFLGLNKGGLVKGYAGGGGVDTMPAMLTKGEYVVNKQATSMFQPLLENINNIGKRKMATGGTTNTKTVTINSPIVIQGGVRVGGIDEKRLAKEQGDMLKRNGII